MQKTGFSMEDILRKYIRYTLNEKPFNPELVASLIQLRKASVFDDSQVAEILNEISRWIVREKGPVVMDMSGIQKRDLRENLLCKPFLERSVICLSYWCSAQGIAC